MAGYVPGVYVLEEIDGAPFTARATLDLTEPGRITGRAPCNGYGGTLEAEYPAFGTGPIVSTQMACEALEAEGVFFAAIEEMTTAESGDGILTLSNEAGREMVFRLQEE